MLRRFVAGRLRCLALEQQRQALARERDAIEQIVEAARPTVAEHLDIAVVVDHATNGSVRQDIGARDQQRAEIAVGEAAGELTRKLDTAQLVGRQCEQRDLRAVAADRGTLRNRWITASNQHREKNAGQKERTRTECPQGFEPAAGVTFTIHGTPNRSTRLP